MAGEAWASVPSWKECNSVVPAKIRSVKLFEFEAKKILREYGIPVPEGEVAGSTGEAEAIARKIAKPVVLKSQILVAGRGKAGGIIFADTPDEAETVASNLIGGTIKGCLVGSLLVEEKLDITDQFYASVAIDRQARKYVVLASVSGGVDIEEVPLGFAVHPLAARLQSPVLVAGHQVAMLAGEPAGAG